MDWMKIGWALIFLMMLFPAWRGYKYWSENSPQAGEGDWLSVVLVLGGVVALVILLVMMV